MINGFVELADDEDEEIGHNVDPSFEGVPSGWLERCRWNVSGFLVVGPGVKISRLGGKSVDEMRGALV